MDKKIVVQYTMACLLITSSVAMAGFQVYQGREVGHGLLMYVAQAFLLAGSIFGLDAYVKIVTKKYPT